MLSAATTAHSSAAGEIVILAVLGLAALGGGYLAMWLAHRAWRQINHPGRTVRPGCTVKAGKPGRR